MAIPVAKLMVYTTMAGIDPLKTLPIMLDAGTNNEDLLNDPFYLGWRHPRLTGNEYAEFIDKFITAVKKKFPHVFLHWEDFGRTNAYQNLVKYRDKTCSFNDDIQGTGAVALAALLGAIQITKTPLADQRIVVFGAGTAGMGITNVIHEEMMLQGLSAETARERFWLVDRQGLLTNAVNQITTAQQPYVRDQAEIQTWKIKNPQQISLLEVIEQVKPTILIGTSAIAQAFDKSIVTTMAKYVEQPIIFPLSNPTEKCEAAPTDLMEWTNGKVLLATGSPFEDFIYQQQHYSVNQCNNYLAFPGIGLGVIAVKAKRVSNKMLRAASLTLSQYANAKLNRLLPTIKQTPTASRQIAIAVAKAAVEEGLAGITIDQPIETLVDKNIWHPHYLPYQRTY
jgi:malate dehydrogenase (oxaloacetate-decarboxylating)